MLESVKNFIDKENLISQNAKIIVGLSGGMDSMALLDILILLGFRCYAAHCNFHLRGEESNRDEKFVKTWCKKTDIPYRSISFDTHQYAANHKISIEMAARELRYNWFETLRKHHGANYIAVTHHKDDSVETVLLNLIRGTGIKGLTGISPKNGEIVRPLLNTTRDEIENYVADRNIPYVTDSTNELDMYHRNSIRLNVIPLLQTLNPSVKETIYRTSQNITEAEKVYSYTVQKSIDKIFINNRINIFELKQEPSPLSVLFELLSPLGFTPSTIEDIYESIDSSPGKQFYSETNIISEPKKYRIIKDRNYFLLNKIHETVEGEKIYYIEEGSKEVFNPLNLKISYNKSPLEININRKFLYIDADKLKFPLILRKWKNGDWFIPFGMKGRKKLSDYFIDQKYSLKDKEDAWLLVTGEDIVWIIGERTDDRYRITESTKNVIIIELAC